MVLDPDLEASVLRWRARALDYALLTVLGVGTVPLLVIFLAVPDALPPGLRLFGLVIYLLFAGVAMSRRVAHRVRALSFLVAGYALAVVMLAARGLPGDGRIVLVALPIYATVFLGPRSGYAAGVSSLAAYAAIAWLYPKGFLASFHRAHDVSLEPRLWLLQGVMLFLVLALLMVLVNQFVVLMRGALVAEREANRRTSAAEREQRRLERVLLDTGERERRAIGHQLHDGPCQQITAALLRCKVAENSLTNRGSREATAHLQAIGEMLGASVGEIHDLARGLSPQELSPGALGEAFDDLAHSVRASGAVECEVLYDAPQQLADPEATTQVFRIAQEAVSNAVRHARANRIRIELSQRDGILRLSVRDDGIGLPASSGQIGMGLRIMRYRAELIGATLAIGVAAGGGTEVTCVLPLLATQTNQAGRG